MALASSSSSSSSPIDSDKPRGRKRKLSESGSESDSSEGSENTTNSAKRQLSEPDDAVESGGEGEEDAEEEEDVKVLSHKQQRRLKKKIAKEALIKDNAKVEDTKQKKHAKVKSDSKGSKVIETNDGEAKLKRQNSIWVGNLSYKTTPDALRTFFKEAGEVTRVHMPMQAPVAGDKGAGQKSRGFAYVDFETPDMKVIATTFSEKNLDGRKLLIKDGDDFTRKAGIELPEETPGAPNVPGGQSGHSKSAQKILALQKQPPIPCLFLGNLGFEATEESIRGMIEGHAKALSGKKAKVKDGDPLELKAEDGNQPSNNDTGIKKVRMGTFEDSGLCKGFAFIDFESTAHATAVLTNPRNHYLDGRKLVMEYASADAARRGGYREKSQKPGGKQKKPAKRISPRKQRIMDRDNTETGQDSRIEEAQKHGPERPTKKPRIEEDGDKRTHKRPKPGAALALAKREKFAIVPSEGTRMTFS